MATGSYLTPNHSRSQIVQQQQKGGKIVENCRAAIYCRVVEADSTGGQCAVSQGWMACHEFKPSAAACQARTSSHWCGPPGLDYQARSSRP
ncbi:hypothetical protein TNCV_1510591 [Trichonephila clavipes]|nr:hypothetical protein TNCV_1510591 [Trichonephila clavipes]